MIDKSFRPDWATIEVVKAIYELLRLAHDDPHVHRFLWATEGCLPIYPFQDIMTKVLAHSKAWMETRHQPKTGNEQHLQFFQVDSNVIPAENVWKTLPTYSILPRRHVGALLKLPARLGCDLFSLFKAVWGPDEIFFGTLLSVLGLLREDEDDEVMRVPPTYAMWRKVNDPNPVSWETFDEGFRRARERGSLFARKFKAGVVGVEEWEEKVERPRPPVEEGGGKDVDRRRSRSRERKRSRSRSRERRRRSTSRSRSRERRRSRSRDRDSRDRGGRNYKEK